MVQSIGLLESTGVVESTGVPERAECLRCQVPSSCARRSLVRAPAQPRGGESCQHPQGSSFWGGSNGCTVAVPHLHQARWCSLPAGIPAGGTLSRQYSRQTVLESQQAGIVWYCFRVTQRPVRTQRGGLQCAACEILEVRLPLALYCYRDSIPQCSLVSN